MKPNMSIHDSDLTKFRDTVFKHEWKESFQTAQVVLAKNILQSTLIVAGYMARSCLRFRQFYDLTWVTKFSGEVIKFLQTDSSEYELLPLPVELEGFFLDAPPGVSNLVTGVEELWKSLAVAHNPEEKALYLLKAFDNFIIGELCHYWAIAHREEWELQEVYQNAERDSEGKKLLPRNIDRNKMHTGIMFLKQPESFGYRAARMLSLADEIELALNI